MTHTTHHYITSLLLALTLISVAIAAQADKGDGTILGLGLLSPEMAGKIFSVAALIQGTLFTIAPLPLAKLYGWNKLDQAQIQHAVEFIGACILATGIVPFFMLFHEWDLRSSMSMRYLFWSVVFLRNVLNGTYKKAGIPSAKMLPVALSAWIGAYGGMTNAEWILTYTKAIDVIYALVALQDILFTEAAQDFWHFNPDDMEKNDDAEISTGRFLKRTFGYFLLEERVQSYLLITSSATDPLTAMALGAFSGLAYFVSSFFITKEISKVSGMPAAIAFAFWLVFFCFSIAAMLHR